MQGTRAPALPRLVSGFCGLIGRMDDERHDAVFIVGVEGALRLNVHGTGCGASCPVLTFLTFELFQAFS